MVAMICSRSPLYYQVNDLAAADDDDNGGGGGGGWYPGAGLQADAGILSAALA